MKHTYSIYVELDALFDTRYPIVKPFVTVKDYISRSNDDFKYLGFKGFSLLYSARTVDVLKASNTTNIHEEITNIYLYKKKELVSEGLVGEIILDINISPYELSDNMKKLLLMSFRNILPALTINLIDIDRDEHILTNYFAIIIYDGIPFVSKLITTKYLKENIKPNVTLITTININSDVTDNAEFASNIMKTVQPYLNLQLVPHTIFTSLKLLTNYAK